MGINKVILVGNLGRDPEMRHTQSGQAVANFTLATNRRWRDKDGQQKEETEWHRIVAWGRLAEICTEYLTKGKQVYVEGRLQTRDWEDREGNKRYTTEIVALDMQMLGRRGDTGGYDEAEPPPRATDATPDSTPSGSSSGSGSGSEDDIPF